jgi:hypothetical protein
MSSSQYPPEEESLFLNDITVRAKGLCALAMHLSTVCTDEDSSSREHLPIMRLLFFIGPRALDLVRQYNDSNLTVGNDILAYQARTIIESLLILRYFVSLPPHKRQQEVDDQLALDQNQIFKEFQHKISAEKRPLLDAEMANFKRIYPKSPTRWDASIFFKNDSGMDRFKSPYTLFNKLAHPTAYNLFQQSVLDQETRICRSEILWCSCECLKECERILQPHYQII